MYQRLDGRRWECFDDWDGATSDGFQQVTELDTIDCVEPHDNEVYATYNMADGSFPGSDAVETAIVTQCEAAFAPYVGTSYAESRLDYGALFPTSESWAEGDREIICFLWDIEFLKLTGSMENSQI